jgi:hypothetical protein
VFKNNHLWGSRTCRAYVRISKVDGRLAKASCVRSIKLQLRGHFTKRPKLKKEQVAGSAMTILFLSAQEESENTR